MRRWLKPSRLPLIVAWLVIMVVVGYVGSHPKLVAPYASRLVSRHLLRIENGGLRVRDFKVRPFEGMDLYGVSLTLPGNSGGMTLVSVDTVAVDFGLAQAIGAVPHLRRVTVRRPEVYSMAGTDTTKARDDGRIDLDLPWLIIDHLVVTDAFLEFSGSDGRLTERISRLDWRGSIQTGKLVRAVMRGVDVDWDTHQSVLSDLRGEVIIDPEGVSVKGLSGRFNEHPVKVDGYRNWDKSLRLQFEGQDVSVAEVENLIDMNIGFAARGSVVGSLEGARDTLRYDGVFTGTVEGYEAQDLVGGVLVLPGEVRLQDMHGVINGADFRGGGVFDITNPRNVKFVLDADVRNVDLAKGLIPGEDDLPLTDGVGQIRIEHTDQPMWTRVSGVLHDGRIEIIPFDTCYIDVEAGTDTVIFNRVELTYQDLHAMLEGFSDSSQIFQGEVSFNSNNLATLPAEWLWPPVAGRANGLGHLNGPLDDLDFAGNLNVYDFDLGPIKARDSDVVLSVTNVLGDPTFMADISGRDFVAGGVDLGDYTLRGSASAAAVSVDDFTAALGDTTAALRFQVQLTDTVKTISVAELTVMLEGTHWGLSDTVSIGLGDDYFSLADLELSSTQGTLSGGGVFERGVTVSGGLKFEQFDLGLINPFVETEEPLTGRLTADLIVGGDPSEPTVKLVGSLLDAPLALARIDTLLLDASYTAGVITLQRMELASEFGAVRGSGTIANPGAPVAEFWQGADLDLALTFVEADWAFLDQFALPALERLRGYFSGEMTLGGSTRDPLVHGQLHSSPFHVHWLHLDEMAAEVWVDSRGLVLGDLRGHKDDFQLSGRIEVPLVFDLLSEPLAPLDGPFYMQLEIPPGTNLEPLSRATNAFVNSSGVGEASVVISGPLGHPFYQGDVKLSDVGFVLRDLEEVYRDFSGEGRFNGDTLTLSNIRGHEGLRGALAGQGTLTFKGLMIETFDLRLDLDRFLLASLPDLRAVASSRNARMTGVIVGPDSVLVPKFHGDFQVHKARYTGNFKEKEGAVDPLAGTVAPDWLADLSLHADPRVAHIINREMELALGGDLTLVRTEDGLTMRGSMDVNKGVLIAFNNKFQVQRGRLDFSQEVGFDPRIDLDAETQYRLRFAGSSNSVIEHIGVHVSGVMSRPEVQFSSERGYSTEAIQRMLLGLEPQATPEGDSRRLANSSISAGFNILEREIAREIDWLDTIEIDQIQRLRDTGNTGLDPLIGVGKYIGSDLYLKYAQGVQGMDDLDIVVEYQINRHLLLQSEMRRRLDENQGESTYNLDLKYRFEY